MPIAMFARLMPGQRAKETGQVLRPDRFPNELHKDLVVERFREKAECSLIERSLADRRVVSPANENNPRLGRISPQAGLHFQAAHVWHPHVENRHATFRLFEFRKKVGRVAKFLHRKTG